MRVVFLNPPSLADDTHDLAPPLWAMLLGSLARRLDCSPYLIDLNLEVLSGEAPLGTDAFYLWAVDKVLRLEPDVVCYSSMGLNGHVSLRIAELIRSARPSLIQFAGGPHFSAIAEEVLQNFSWIDGVFLGEAEGAFARCLTALKSGCACSELLLPGIVIQGGARGVRVFSRPKLEEIPKPDYSLADIPRYFAHNERRLLDFEAGRRGCIYSCRYCYAPGHFGRGERSPSSARFIEEMAEAAELGARHLFIVTDNFANFPDQTASLCDEIAACHLNLNFNCYVTLAQLNERVVASMARAGCTSVYVGVDAVHPDARREFAKGLFRSRNDLFYRIDLCLAHGISPNLAFLLEEAEKSQERFDATVATAAAAAVRGCSITFNTLTVYPRTPVAQSRKWNFIHSDLKSRICFDSPEVVHDNPYSQRHPELFPFHSSHRPLTAHGKLLMTAHALKTLSGCAPELLYEVAEAGALAGLLEQLMRGLSPGDFAGMSSYSRREEILVRLFKVIERAQSSSSPSAE